MNYWIKASASFLAVFLVCIVVFAATSYWQGNEDTVTETPGKSFIWEITSSTNHIYLLGSIHVGSEELYPLDSAIEEAFESSKYLVVELDASTIDVYSPDLLKTLIAYSMYPKGQGLKENLPADLYEQLKNMLDQFHLKIETVNNCRPWLLSTAISANASAALNFDNEHGIDYHFLYEAIQNNIRILQFESFEEQLAALSDVPDEVMVKGMISDTGFYSAEQTMDLIFSAWETGNAAKMEGITFLGSLLEPETAPYFDIIIDQRNFKWMEKIENYLTDDETYFVVVGAGHLVGKNGLIYLLKEKGYTLEQLNKTE